MTSHLTKLSCIQEGGENCNDSTLSLPENDEEAIEEMLFSFIISKNSADSDDMIANYL
jgi:hypothetical protein